MTMEVERMTRLELATYAMARRRSSQLSYIRLSRAMVSRIGPIRNRSGFPVSGPFPAPVHFLSKWYARYPRLCGTATSPRGLSPTAIARPTLSAPAASTAASTRS